MKVEFLEVNKELFRVITADVFSTNDELKAMVTLEINDWHNIDEIDGSSDIVMHGTYLDNHIVMPIEYIDPTEKTGETLTAVIMSSGFDSADSFIDISNRYQENCKEKLAMNQVTDSGVTTR